MMLYRKAGLLVLSACITLLVCAGCGKTDKLEAGLTGYSKRCVGGVEYLIFNTGASVAYNQDGTIKACK